MHSNSLFRSNRLKCVNTYISTNLDIYIYILHNINDCSEMIKRLDFRVNQFNSRNNLLLYLFSTSLNYMPCTPGNMLMSASDSTKDLD